MGLGDWLKRLFGGGKKNEQTHEDVAYEVMKQKLMELIGNEDKANPLSDEELDSLQDEFTRLREHAESRLHSIREHRSRRSAAEKKSG